MDFTLSSQHNLELPSYFFGRVPTDQVLSCFCRILWYIEWYTQKPYDISTLYWSVRLLQVTLFHRDSALRGPAVQELLDTHGIVILVR